MKTLRIAVSLAVALLAPATLSTQAQTTLPAGAATARVIVKFRADSALMRKQAASAAEQHASQAQALGERIGMPMHSGAGVAERTQVVFAAGVSSEALAERLSREADVEYAVPDRRKRIVAAPNDPLYAAGPTIVGQTGGPVSGQWYLRAPDTTIVSAINAEAAWDVSVGSPTVVVADLDTGIRPDHPDLAANLLDGYDMVGADRDDNGNAIVPAAFQSANDGDGRDADPSDPGDGITQTEANTVGGLFYHCTTPDSSGNYPGEPSSWHGTQTAGLLGAVTNNGSGMASVGRTVRILPVRVLSKCGGWDSDITAGMLWAAGITVPGAPSNPNPAKVLNMSLGGTGSCSALYRDVVAQVIARGAVIVASAGNGGGFAASEPADCSGVIGVSGLRHVGTKVGFSDIGPEVSIAAPGGNCVNTASTAPCLYPILTTSNSGQFAPVAGAGGAIYTDAFNASIGTSFSAPLVAGTAALILSVRSDLAPADVRTLLRSTSRAFPTSGGTPGTLTCHAPNSTAQDECYCTTATCGAGMLDAGAALAAAGTFTPGTGGGSSGGDSGGGGALGAGWLLMLLAAVAVLARRELR